MENNKPIQPMQNDMIVEDSENFMGGKDSSFKKMVLQQWERTILEGSKELDEGGLKRRIINGEAVEILMPNQKEIFKNNVNMLWSLLLPKIKENQALIAEHVGDFDTELKNIGKSYAKELQTIQVRLMNLQAAEYGKINKTNYGMMSNELMRIAKEQHDSNLMAIFNKKLTAISFLLSKLNYFEEASV